MLMLMPCVAVLHLAEGAAGLSPRLASVAEDSPPISRIADAAVAEEVSVLEAEVVPLRLRYRHEIGVVLFELFDV